MTFGEKLAYSRKQKKMSQSALGKASNISGDIIGRYERGVISPSIDVIIKISDVLEVSIDFLVGKTDLKLDSKTMKRLEDIDNLPEDEKIHLFKVLDALLRDSKTKASYE